MSIDAFEKALLQIDRLAAEKILHQSLVSEALEDVVQFLVVPTLDRIGKKWEQSQVALSQVYMSAKICEDMLQAVLPTTDIVQKTSPRLGMAVLLDHHLLGKQILVSMIRSSGYAIQDYGSIDPITLVDQVEKDGIQILFISTLMVSAAKQVRTVKEELSRRSLPTKIMVGGAPFRYDSQLYLEVGADATGVGLSDALRFIDENREELS